MMNIETNSKIISTTQATSTAPKPVAEDTPKFSEELNSLAKEEQSKPEKIDTNDDKNSDSELNEIYDGLQNTVEEINKLNLTKKPVMLNQTEENSQSHIKDVLFKTDNINDNEDNSLINNDLNIQETKEPLMPQMNANMNFNSNGQPFSEFINPQQEQNQLQTTEKDLAEEAAILSSMSENIAIANKNIALSKSSEKQIVEKASVLETVLPDTEEIIQPKVKTVSNLEGVKKVDTKSNITVETVVKYDTVIMDKNDVEFFTKLVENGSVEMDSQQAVKSVQVSKTLADLIAKATKDNQPIRIDFDNDISVIIKIGKDGKISADFLPSSQIAEAYLKENLPLLKQRFDENNINYDELNQRKHKQNDKEDKKKGRKDE